MPQLESIILSMVEMFESHAGQEGKKNQIKSDDFKRLMDEEVNTSGLKDTINPNDISEAIEMPDKNHDGEVNFREFSRCVASIAKAYYKNTRGKGGKKYKGEEGDQEA